MKTRLFLAEIKKNLTALPAFLAALILLGAVVSALVFAGSRMLYKSENVLNATIAVVSYEKEGSYVERFASYLGELSSASSGLDFEMMTEEEAADRLDSGEVFAIMLIPEGMMNGILYGQNIHASVILPDDPSIQSMVFAELTKAGADLLSAAQSGTYTATELYYRTGRTGELSDAYDQIDLINFGYVLSREDCFTRAVILPGENEIKKGEAPADSVMIYYVCSGILLFVFFAGSAFSNALKRDDRAFYSVYASKGRKWYGYVLIKYAAHCLVLFVSLTVVYAAALVFQAVKGISVIPLSAGMPVFLLLLSLITAAFDILCHMLAKNASGAVLIQLSFSLVMLFAGGAILPSAFLPDLLSGVGELLPASALHHSLLTLMNGAGNMHFTELIIHAVLLIMLAMGAFCLRAGGDRL